MLAYAGLGYIVIFPDYLGFNDSDRPQRYFSKLAEGHVMLDAVRAVFRFFESPGHAVRPSPAVFLTGYSQGEMPTSREPTSGPHTPRKFRSSA